MFMLTPIFILLSGAIEQGRVTPPPLLPFTLTIGGRRLGSCASIGSSSTTASGRAANFHTTTYTLPTNTQCPCVAPNCTAFEAAGWSVDTTVTVLDAVRTQVVVVYTPQTSGIQITRTTTLYSDLDAAETVLEFRETSNTQSDVICGIDVLDVAVITGDEPTLHTFNGSSAHRFDYQPGHRRLDTQDAPPPWGLGNMHGPNGQNTVADGYRLWTDTSSAVKNQTGPSCVALCQQDTACIGVTLSHAATTGINDCYLILNHLNYWDAEPEYSSWTKQYPGPPQTNAADFGPTGGRSSDPVLPYMAVAGQSFALVASIGWSGNWKARIGWNSSTHTAALKIGHDSTKLCTPLEAGKSLRTMRVVTVNVTASELVSRRSSSADPAGPLAREGFNRHRRFMVQYKLPKDPDSGHINGSIVASWSWIGWPQTANESVQLWHVHAVKNTSVEMYWLDAGWFNGGFPNGVGNWQIPISETVNQALYPERSLARLGEVAHRSPNRVGFITWFEPERAHEGSYLATKYPEYCLGPGPDYLVNLGDPDAKAFLYDYLSDAVTQYGLDVLRIDYNLDPGPHWEDADAKTNSTGLTEHRYVSGLYDLWDRILTTHPGLMIDDCSSGGRRIDVETLARSFPLWRSDYAGQGDPTSHQIMSMGLSQFAPISSGAVFSTDPYLWRSAGVVGKTISWGSAGWQSIVSSQSQIALLNEAVVETQSLRHVAIYGDYYPLTDVSSLSETTWAAYQFDLAGQEGFGVYFRNSNATDPSMVSQLQGLSSTKRYSVTTFTNYSVDGPPSVLSGTELADMTIHLNQKQSRLIKYELYF